MIDVGDSEYLRILINLVSTVAQKETKLEYLEASSIHDPYLDHHRDGIEDQKRTIKTLIEYLNKKLINNKHKEYFCGVYEGDFVHGKYVGDGRYNIGSTVFTSEYIDVNMKNVYYFDESWMLELLYNKICG